MFHAHGMLVSGGNFVHIQHSSSNATFKDLSKYAVLSATHDSGEVFDRPGCHENTRIAALDRLWSWTNAKKEHDDKEEGSGPAQLIDETQQPIMWVYGDAGAGKSALAQSHAVRCAQEGRLLGSFFFSRNDTKRSTHAHLVATIAYQVATFVPELRILIVSAIEQDPNILEKSLETQFATLIVNPINILSKNHPQPLPHLIIIDGLDECSQDDRRQQSHILKVLSQAVLNCSISLKVVFASRAEVQIQSKFDSNPLNDISTRIALDASFRPDDDIRLFLNDTFRDISRTHPLRRHIPTAWPGYQVVEELVRKSSGQFIFASTAAKYISSPHHKPADRLEIILGLRERASDKDIPFAALDALYCQIFSSVPEENVNTVRNIIGLVISSTTHDFNDTETQCVFLSLSLEDLDFYLKDVTAIATWDDYGISITHASLSDFLFDQKRSGHYHLGRTFAASILTVCINNLKQDTTEEVMEISLNTFRDFCDTAEQTPDLRECLLAFSLDWIYNWSRKDGPWLDDKTGTDDMDEKDKFGALRAIWDFVEFSTIMFNFLLTLPDNRDILDHHLKDFDQCMMKLIAKAINGDDDLLLITTLSAIPHPGPPSWALDELNCQSKELYVALSSSRVRPFLKKEPPENSPVFNMFYHFCAVLFGVHSDNFFEDPCRSGCYTLTGARFSDAALACLVFLCQNKYRLRNLQQCNFLSFQFISGYYAITYLPDLLSRSTASQKLTAFICSGDFEKLWEENRIFILSEGSSPELDDVENHIVKGLQACKTYLSRTNTPTVNLNMT